MTSSQHGLYIWGHTHVTMARTTSLRLREGKLISKIASQFGLKAATRLHEVGIASNRWSAIQR